MDIAVRVDETVEEAIQAGRIGSDEVARIGARANRVLGNVRASWQSPELQWDRDDGLQFVPCSSGGVGTEFEHCDARDSLEFEEVAEGLLRDIVGGGGVQ